MKDFHGTSPCLMLSIVEYVCSYDEEGPHCRSLPCEVPRGPKECLYSLQTSPLAGKESLLLEIGCYDFSCFVLFTYVFSLFLEVSHGAAALTHFSLTHITATLLTLHCCSTDS